MGHQRDDTLKLDLGKIKPRPVFIIGLHRSGTTFLYQTITEIFPVSSLTLYHLFYYNNIIYNRCNNVDKQYQENLDKTFKKKNMENRGIDRVPLFANLPEEYGWLLRRRFGTWYTNKKTAPLVDEICRKLHFIKPSALNVLLKNPYDTGHVGELLGTFPEAKFIFLYRDPLAIVNSQFFVARQLAERKNPFINMLFAQIPFGRAWPLFLRTLRKSLGQSLYSRLALNYILRKVIKELGELEASWQLIPPHLRLILQYEEIAKNEQMMLEQVASFLGYPLTAGTARRKSDPRNLNFFPEVRSIETNLLHRLKRQGIAQKSLVNFL